MKAGATRVRTRGSQSAARFKAPEQSLGPLDSAAAARVLTAAADITLLLTADGTIRDLAIGDARLRAELPEASGWRGRPWLDTVTVESRDKIEAMLAEVGDTGRSAPRHVNHPAEGSDVAIQYSVVLLDGEDWIAFGTDLRPWSRLQHRLIHAQHTMERDYGALRRAQGRFRLVFETCPEPLFVVDAANGKVLEINQAGRLLLAGAQRRESGWSFGSLLDRGSRSALGRFFGVIEAAGFAEPVAARLAADRRPVMIVADLLREDDCCLLLVRIRDKEVHARRSAPHSAELLAGALARSPDALLVCDAQGTVRAANETFAALCQLPARATPQGRPIETWLGRDGGVLLANLQQRGTIRLFATRLRDEGGGETDVEISGWTVETEPEPLFGLALRDVHRRLAEKHADAAPFPDSVEQLAELVGRVSLKDLIRRATDTMERVYIETALKLTGDNRASAAEMLGLSRQSLYLKLNRLGIGEREED